MATALEINDILTRAAGEAFDKVNKMGKACQAAQEDNPELDLESPNLYVYPDGDWRIDFPQYLNDHRTLAQASVWEYEDVNALVAALGETVADQDD